MSEIQNNTFTCPQCGEDGPLQMWTSINVAHDPDARRRIEDLSVFEWTCPNCKKTALVLHPCLYHDVANEFNTEIKDVAAFSTSPIPSPTLVITKATFDKSNAS